MYYYFRRLQQIQQTICPLCDSEELGDPWSRRTGDLGPLFAHKTSPLRLSLRCYYPCNDKVQRKPQDCAATGMIAKLFLFYIQKKMEEYGPVRSQLHSRQQTCDWERTARSFSYQMHAAGQLDDQQCFENAFSCVLLSRGVAGCWSAIHLTPPSHKTIKRLLDICRLMFTSSTP